MKYRKEILNNIIYINIIYIFFTAYTFTSTIKKDFIKGVDISMLKQLEDNGAKFYDEKGIEKDCIEILKEHGVNWIRIRTWVNPVDKTGNLLGGGNNNKETTIKLAKKIKSKQLKYLLDFHYSDFWSDPGKQYKPKEWENLKGKKLEKKVYEYTKDMILSLKAQNALPDMVQIGNEVNGGMLWPDGKTWKQGKEKIGGYNGFVKLLKAGIKAVKDIDKKIKIMIHLSDGGNNKLYRTVFDELIKRKVEFDIIGISFYPYWHGTFNELTENLSDISKRYKKDVIVVETAYAYTLENGDSLPNIFGKTEERKVGYIASVEGQKQVIKKLMDIIYNVPNNRGKGFFYWGAEWIPIKNSGWKIGEGNAWENQAMFDFNGKALETLNIFKENP
ncbi:arabinogalactan endo-1,4-beta-galactosidase [Hypnocyclicus thermotrophus]|uniref:Arabinogalactan endo-beta-1,4-galactanase n=1 Tax=Hypnocyclicus thermotrophus TaxID=1627895 RepID=A0AA46E026_9FUSO|nr:glycosyl hydrolase 53 family protein [Hypnocyclicus thermotrophus]TDT72039.1 arabinogalactan endo-1,4-beta-galactosidase [Hypnocyclicus thermotrophus]